MCSSTSPPTMCAPGLLRTSRPTGPATRNSMPAATFSCSEHSKIPSVMAPWRSSGSQHVADPAHNVVPPVRHHLDSQVSKVGLLGGQEPPNQVRRDVHLGGRHAVRTHPVTLADR